MSGFLWKRRKSGHANIDALGEYPTLNSWRLTLGDSDLRGGRRAARAIFSRPPTAWWIVWMLGPYSASLPSQPCCSVTGLEGRSHWFVLAFAGRVRSARRPNQFTYREAPQ